MGLLDFFKSNDSNVNNDLDIIIDESNQLLASNNSSLIFENVNKYIVYFKNNKNELSNFNSQNIDKLDKIEQIAFKAVGYFGKREFQSDEDLKQILVFTLIVINKICAISSNEKYIEDKLTFFQKQPSFMLTIFIIEAEKELLQLKLFQLDDDNDCAVKALQLLSAEIILTSFLKDRQYLLFNDSIQQLNSNYFYPIVDANSVKNGIKKVENILGKTLTKMFFK